MLKFFLRKLFPINYPELGYAYTVEPSGREQYEVGIAGRRVVVPAEYGDRSEGKQVLLLYPGQVKNWHDGSPVSEDDRERVVATLERFLAANGRVPKRV